MIKKIDFKNEFNFIELNIDNSSIIIKIKDKIINDRLVFFEIFDKYLIDISHFAILCRNNILYMIKNIVIDTENTENIKIPYYDELKDTVNVSCVDNNYQEIVINSEFILKTIDDNSCMCNVYLYKCYENNLEYLMRYEEKNILEEIMQDIYFN